MTVNKRSVRNWEESMLVPLTGEQKAIILDRFGSEPGNGHAWSEQDIAEGIRIICRDHPAPERPLPDFLKRDC